MWVPLTRDRRELEPRLRPRRFGDCLRWGPRRRDPSHPLRDQVDPGGAGLGRRPHGCRASGGGSGLGSHGESQRLLSDGRGALGECRSPSLVPWSKSARTGWRPSGRSGTGAVAAREHSARWEAGMLLGARNCWWNPRAWVRTRTRLGFPLDTRRSTSPRTVDVAASHPRFGLDGP